MPDELRHLARRAERVDGSVRVVLADEAALAKHGRRAERKAEAQRTPERRYGGIRAARWGFFERVENSVGQSPRSSDVPCGGRRVSGDYRDDHGRVGLELSRGELLDGGPIRDDRAQSHQQAEQLRGETIGLLDE